MLPIVDEPTLQYIIEEAIDSGIEEILIVTGCSKKSIEDHFDRSVELELDLEQKGKTEIRKMVQDISNMVNIHYIRQKEPKGLGHAIHCAKSFIGDEPFAVFLGDDIVDSEDTDKYGILDAKHIENTVYKVKDMVEKPKVDEAPSNIAILGRYIITPAIFDILENQEPGKGGEIQLTDALKILSEHEAIYAYGFEGKRYDVGLREELIEFLESKKELQDKFSELD